MELMSGQTLVRKTKEEVSADAALADKEIIGFYFSAHWCPPCRTFTPILADCYEELTEAGKPFEVVFVSSDQSAEALFEYMEGAHGDWLALPHGSDFKEQLGTKFGVEGIPMLIIVKKDGTVVTTDGRKDVERKGAAAFDAWMK